MKKIFTAALAFMLFQVTASAQNVRIGVMGGAASSKYDYTVNGHKDEYDRKTGVMAGLILEMPVRKNVSFQTGLQYTQKGFVQNIKGDILNIYFNLSNNIIEIPLNFIYRAPSGKGGFLFGAGPSVAAAISGKMKYNTNGQSGSQKTDIGNSNSDFIRRMDMGVNVLTGYAFSDIIRLTLNYNKGINNLSPASEAKIHSQYLGLGLSYFFKSKPQKK